MAAKKTGGSMAGRHVGFKYRSAHDPKGTVTGVAKRNAKGQPTMLDIRPDKSSRHPGEPKIIHRSPSKVRSV